MISRVVGVVRSYFVGLLDIILSHLPNPKLMIEIHNCILKCFFDG